MTYLRAYPYHVAVVGVVLCAMVGYWFFFIRSTTAENMRHVYDVPLLTYEGEEVFINEFTKRSDTVVFMWATWCPYCAEELRNLSALKTRYGDDITVIAVNRGESKGEAQAYTAALSGVTGITYLLDPVDALYKGMGGYAMPETFFVAKRGDVVHHQRGPLELQGAASQLEALFAW